MSETHWEAIPGFNGYEASTDGAVRSWLLPGGCLGARRCSPHELVQHPSGPYVRVNARVAGKNVPLLVHRAVLFAFRGLPGSKQESRHLDGDPLNNQVENLSWGTKAENEADKERHGTAHIGSRGMRRKLRTEDVKNIRRKLASGDSLASLGREFSVTWQSIQAIKDGRSWKHV